MASPLELMLSVKRGGWRNADPGAAAQADAAFRQVRPRILERDRHTCRACGFKAAKWQEVHHCDNDHANNEPTNLATLCGFCHMVFHIGRTNSPDTAVSQAEAVLIFLPEISQVNLHHLVRSVFVAQAFATKHKTDQLAAQHKAASLAVYQELVAREGEATARLGFSNPALLGEFLLEMSDADYARRGEILDGIRLLPLGRRMQGGRDVFMDTLTFWVSPEGPYSALPPATWPTLKH